MAEYPLQFASRQIRRTFERAIGRSIPKILTELITNADDSYRRLVSTGRRVDAEEPLPITVTFEKAKRRFKVSDCAEGLTDVEMRERFVTYGQESLDRSQGLRTRSLFGKGLRDVLFTQRYGQVKSIKDGKFYNCQFRWKKVDGQDMPVIDIKPTSRITEELRDALGIPVNGTEVEFVLSENVRKPQADKLIEKLSHFYMLRMINSSPHREVRFETIGKGGDIRAEAQLTYTFPEADIVDEINEELRTEDGAIILVKGTIGLSATDLSQGEAGYEDREGGLLILDEDEAVLDLTLFGFDDDPNARRIVGMIRLIGAGDYIRRKLNEATPEELLLESRDGFDKNHGFYRLLRSKMQPHISPIVELLREDRTPPKSTLSEPTREKHKQVFDVLNRLYKEMLGKTGKVPTVPTSLREPPASGIAFATSHVSIQTGVNTPVPLLLNRALVRPGDDVTLQTDTGDLLVTPSHLIIDEVDDVTKAQIKMLRVISATAGIQGKLTAQWKDVVVDLAIMTTEREVVTPINGLEFERDEYSVRLGARRHLRLFVDLEKIPVGSEIHASHEGTALKLANAAARLEESDRITEKVAFVEIPVVGIQITKDVVLTASFGPYVAGTAVSVVKREKQERAMGGIFQGYNFVPLERKIQAQFDPQGWILINTKDPVNQRYFGPDPFRSVEEYAHCQVRLADLILNECLQMMVSEALQDGKLDHRFPNNPEIDLRNYVDAMKFEYGPQIHSLIVTKA